MSKPIFIVKLPLGIEPYQIDIISEKVRNNINDYHTLVIACSVEDISFECYNTTNLDVKNFEDLQILVKQLMNENN
jgi:hypothetical protein